MKNTCHPLHHRLDQGSPRPRVERDPRSGAVLFFVVALIGFVGLLAFTSFTMCKVDLTMAQNHMRNSRAFMHTDGGIEYVKSQLEQRLAGGATLDALQNTVNIQPPSGMTFDAVTQLTQLPDTNLYTFTVTGRDRTAQTSVEATIRRDNALSMGIFGNESLEFYPNLDVYSYYSDLIPNPLPSDSTGEATVGSNEALSVQPNVHLDGEFVIGEDDLGNIGSYPAGHDVREIDRVEPDPLGAVGGTLAGMIADARTVNDNGGVSFINPSGRLRIWNSTGTLTAGNYHVMEAEIKGDLNIDTSGGRVSIFLEGGFETWPGAHVNVTGDPDDFRIYSNSSEEIMMRPDNTFKGLIYAPFADVNAWPNGDFYGIIWSHHADLHPAGDVYVDLSILEKIKSNRILIVAWKEIRR